MSVIYGNQISSLGDRQSHGFSLPKCEREILVDLLAQIPVYAGDVPIVSVITL